MTLRSGFTALSILISVWGLCHSSEVAAQSSSNSAFEEAAELSPQQKASRAEAYIAEMNDKLREAFTLLEDARLSDDLERINCVTEAITALRGLLKISEKNLLNLQEAVARGEKGNVDHEYVKITIAYNKVDELLGQAKSCGSPDAMGTVDGRPIVEKAESPDLPQSDPEKVGTIKDDDVFLERPPAVSPIE